MTIPVGDLDIAMTPEVRRIAILADQFSWSNVLQYGYGMGEAIAVAATLDPTTIEALAAQLTAYSDDDIAGQPISDIHRSLTVIADRNQLMAAVRDIIATHPKPDVTST